jgi:hypothetical protein
MAHGALAPDPQHVRYPTRPSPIRKIHGNSPRAQLPRRAESKMPLCAQLLYCTLNRRLQFFCRHKGCCRIHARGAAPARDRHQHKSVIFGIMSLADSDACVERRAGYATKAGCPPSPRTCFCGWAGCSRVPGPTRKRAHAHQGSSGLSANGAKQSTPGSAPSLMPCGSARAGGGLLRDAALERVRPSGGRPMRRSVNAWCAWQHTWRHRRR